MQLCCKALLEEFLVACFQQINQVAAVLAFYINIMILMYAKYDDWCF